MLTNESVWHHYQNHGDTPYVSPLFIPYLREVVRDKWGNDVEINTWQKLGCGSTESNALFSPELVRIAKDVEFQRMFSDDPCPDGWVPAPETGPQSAYRQGETPATAAKVGYCVRAPLKHEPVFYSKKAFIPQRQYWNGPAKNVCEQATVGRRISEQTDMRTVSPFTGNYEVYYNPVMASSNTRYAPPIPPNPKGKYDQSWALPRQSRYASMATTDSYLA
jgi:hypothetical protein